VAAGTHAQQPPPGSSFEGATAGSSDSSDLAALRARGAAKTARPLAPGKKFGAFLSHYKAECGAEARLVCEKLSAMVPDREFFIDSGESGMSGMASCPGIKSQIKQGQRELRK